MLSYPWYTVWYTMAFSQSAFRARPTQVYNASFMSVCLMHLHFLLLKPRTTVSVCSNLQGNPLTLHSTGGTPYAKNTRQDPTKTRIRSVGEIAVTNVLQVLFNLHRETLRVGGGMMVCVVYAENHKAETMKMVSMPWQRYQWNMEWQLALETPNSELILFRIPGLSFYWLSPHHHLAKLWYFKVWQLAATSVIWLYSTHPHAFQYLPTIFFSRPPPSSDALLNGIVSVTECTVLCAQTAYRCNVEIVSSVNGERKGMVETYMWLFYLL